MIRDFFVEDEGDSQFPGYMVPADLYLRYESIFFKLILSTKKRVDMENKFGITENLDFCDLMDQVFGARPSVNNLNKFFKNEVI